MLEWTVGAFESAKKVVDYGSGTGNFAARLKFAEPSCQVIGLDISPECLTIAKEKIKLFTDNDSEDDFIFADFTKSDFECTKIKNADGALVVNVCFTLPFDNMLMFLNIVQTNLRTEGILVFNEPTKVCTDRIRICEFIRQIAQDAVSNRAPMTEFDLALMTYYNLKNVSDISKSNLFSSNKLKEIISKTGFIFTTRT